MLYSTEIHPHRMKACQAPGRENDRPAPDVNQGGEERMPVQCKSISSRLKMGRHPSSGVLSTGKTWTCWRQGPEERHKNDQRDETPLL